MAWHRLIVLLFGLQTLVLVKAYGQQNFVFHYPIPAEKDISLTEASNGDVVMAGTENDKIFCIRFYPRGSVLWKKEFSFDASRLKFGDLTVDRKDRTLITFTERNGNGFYLIRFDKNGKVDLRKNYVITGKRHQESLPKSVWVGQKGHYFIYGYHHVGNGNGEAFLLEANEKGAVLNDRSYSRNELKGVAAKAPDGGSFIALGEALIRTEANGDIRWRKKLQTAYHDALNIVVTESGEAMVLQTTNNQNQFMVIKVDKAGNLEWQTKEIKFQGIGKIEVNGMAITPDSGILLSGRVNTGGAVPRNLPTVIKISRDGQYEFMRYFRDKESGNPLYSGGYSVFQYGNKNVYYVAGKKSFDPNQPSQTVFIQAHSLKKANDCVEKLGFNTDTKAPISLTPKMVQTSKKSWSATNFSANLQSLSLNKKTVCFSCLDPEVNLGNDTTICPQDTLLLRTNFRRSQFSWNTGSDKPSIKVAKAGKYWVTVKNPCGEDSDTIKVDKSPVAEAKYTINPRKPGPGEKVVFKDSNAATIYETWHFGNGMIDTGARVTHTYDSSGKFFVSFRFKDSNECRYEVADSVNILFYSLYLPDAFSPNGDGHNDRFKPVGYGIKNYRLEVYNRWGERVFKGQNEGWDGNYKGQKLPAGTYIFQLEVRNINENVFNKKGVVRLIR